MIGGPIDDLRRRLDDLRREVEALGRREIPPGAVDYVALTGNQTIAGTKTFSDGIAFANETLSTYDQGTWSPVITGSTGNPTITYTLQSGQYTRIGNVVFFSFSVTINTISGGSGNAEFSLPLTVGATLPTVARPTRIDLPGTSAGVVFVPVATTAIGQLQAIQDDSTSSPVQISNLAANDNLLAAGLYFV